MLGSSPRALAAALVLASALGAQSGTVYPVPGSQVNVTGATMAVSGTVDPTPTTSIPFSATQPGSPSATVVSETFYGGFVSPLGTSTTLNLALAGAADAPFSLLASLPQSNFNCSVIQPPCVQGPWLPSALPTPFGSYHAGFPYLAVLDGIGLGGGVPATLNPLGTFGLTATLPWSSSGPFGTPENVAVQALVVDPAAAAGLSLSAAFSNARWIISCPVCL